MESGDRAEAQQDYRRGEASLFCCGKSQTDQDSTSIGGSRGLWGVIGWRSLENILEGVVLSAGKVLKC